MKRRQIKTIQEEGKADEPLAIAAAPAVQTTSWRAPPPRGPCAAGLGTCYLCTAAHSSRHALAQPAQWAHQQCVVLQLVTAHWANHNQAHTLIPSQAPHQQPPAHVSVLASRYTTSL